MTTLTEAQITQVLRDRLAALIADLHAQGLEDGEAMYLLGAGAARLCDTQQVESWAAFKQKLKPAEANQVLEQCRLDGNRYVAAGQKKPAYAIEAIALSVAAGLRKDDVVQQGEELLDAAIERALANFRQHAHTLRPLN